MTEKLNQLTNWFRAQSTVAKLLIIGGGLSAILFASPVLAVIASVGVFLGLAMVAVQGLRRKSVKTGATILIASLVGVFVLSGVSSAIYGPQETSTPSNNQQQAKQEGTTDTTEKTTKPAKEHTEKTQPEEEQAVAPEKKKSKPEPQPSVAEEKPKKKSGAQNTALVTEVVDGDTIDISPAVHGENRVRLIGVDTPEVHGGREPCGQAASAFTTDMLEGERVRLEFDEDLFDPYDRLLAYVYLSDGRMFNEMLVEKGYASVSTYYPNDRYEQRFIAAEATAAEPACATTASATATATATPTATATATAEPGGGGIDARLSNGVDDVNCSDLPGPIPTPPGDEDNLDADGDGTACDS
jgi:micrococcal nuclease